jgi:hypothetical protein
MRGKKGDIELQFNWIFVFIVGTLILAAAAGFVATQKKNSDTLVSGQIIRFVRSVLTISSATPGKAAPPERDRGELRPCGLLRPGLRL